MTETLDALVFFVYRMTCGLAGLAVVIAGTCMLMQWALERVLCVAAIIEAAREAQKQGRAPILKAWLSIKPWWRA